MYVEIETAADAAHNPTGLLRVHRRGLTVPIGPSDGISAGTVERYPRPPVMSVAVGPAWRTTDGTWVSLASCVAKAVPVVDLRMIGVSRDRVAFALTYHGD